MSLARLLDPSPSVPAAPEVPDPTLPVFTVDGVLSASECAALVAVAEALGFAPAPITVGPGQFAMAPGIRSNTRVMFDDPELASALWARLQPVLPDAGWWGRGTPLGLNERFRLYRYDPGQAFRWHRDGSFRRPTGEWSCYTLMIYLDDAFTGGRTEFARGPVIEPRTGRALVFLHPLKHQGATVRSGSKHVLRTDIMFPG